jgi:amino acid permease
VGALMYDIEDFAIGAFLVLCVLALIGIGVVAIADGVSTAEGTVTEKYYDDPDWVCTKGCYRTSTHASSAVLMTISTLATTTGNDYGM